ncbi:MAG: hypothetical protein EOO73_06985 [Myxococcales bacterium]|nr:MAG: hypothetical protein EOO73_06985 [Myxococcales bacterium]
MRRSTLKTCSTLPLAGLLLTSLAHAEEPRKVSEPSVLREPSEVVQVVDAFDDDDLFDLHLSLGYQSTWKSADILRESSLTDPGFNDGGYSRANLNVAHYSERVSRLNTRADIGLYKDLALVIRMPVVLSDDRELKGLAGSESNQAYALAGAPGEQLFSLPFKSPTRSGIEYLAMGIDAAPMNQARDSTKPTWMIGIEGRFSVSEPMHACNKNPSGLNPNSMLDPSASQQSCAHPSDVNRNGVGGEYPAPRVDGGSLEGSFSGGRKAGVSRGTTGLELHTMISRRVKYIEPYGGFRALFEFQNDSSDYGSTDLKGSLVNHPPLRGTMIFGLNVIPYEIREQFQRLAFDFRFTGTYVSEGRDYSELFDALGTSDAATLRYPNFAEYQASPNGSVVNPNSQRVYFTGLTDVQQHGVYTLSGSVNWQVGEFVKFNVGGGYTILQSHFLTFDQACNPDFASDLSKAGPCKAPKADGSGDGPSGIPNPNYRKSINDPGHRFKVSGASAFDAWINATVMF